MRVHKCIRHGQLACFGRHYECWKIYKGFSATCAPSRRHLFQGRPCVFQQDNAKPHSAAITTAWLHSRRVRVLKWPACSPDLSPIKNIWHIYNEKYVKNDHKLFSSWKPIPGKNGTKFQLKTPESHKLDAQTSSNCFEKKRRTILRPVAGITFKMSSFCA